MRKCLKRHLCFLVIIAIIFLLPKNSLASSLSKLSDRMSRGAPGIAANHEIKFLTQSGIGESSMFIDINFASGFNLSSINFNDVDLFHGPVTGLESEEAINSVATDTEWGASVSGNSLILTHPTNNDHGDILPLDNIIVRIGTQASGGTHQIINPTIIGSKIISITGNYGDAGKLAVAIFRDQVGVRAGEESQNPSPPAMPTLDQVICPAFKPLHLLTGTTAGGTVIFINGSADYTNYPSYGTWSYIATLNLGVNHFDIVARDTSGQNSAVLAVDISRWRTGDTNGNSIVDDFDLAGVAFNWETNWCFGDFNEDKIVDDFDLSGLAAHWDNIY